MGVSVFLENSRLTLLKNRSEQLKIVKGCAILKELWLMANQRGKLLIKLILPYLNPLY